MVKSRKNRINLNSEAGVTLIELLAALAILSLIVTVFLAFFIQSARTTNRSSEVNEATFLAQEEMELLVYDSTNGNLPENLTNGEEIKEKSPYTVKLSFIEETNDFYKVIVEVFEGNTTNPEYLKAIMENRLPFDGIEEDD